MVVQIAADKSLVTKFGLWRAACLFGVTFILGGEWSWTAALQLAWI